MDHVACACEDTGSSQQRVLDYIMSCTQAGVDSGNSDDLPDYETACAIAAAPTEYSDTAPSVMAALAVLRYMHDAMYVADPASCAVVGLFSWTWSQEPFDAHVEHHKLVMAVQDTVFADATLVWLGSTACETKTLMLVFYETGVTDARNNMMELCAQFDPRPSGMNSVLVPATSVFGFCDLLNPEAAPPVDFRRSFAVGNAFYTEIYTTEASTLQCKIPSIYDSVIRTNGTCGGGCDSMYDVCSECFNIRRFLDEVTYGAHGIPVNDHISDFIYYVPREEADGYDAAVWYDMASRNVNWLDTDAGLYVFARLNEHTAEFLKTMNVKYVVPLDVATHMNFHVTVADYPRKGYGPHRSGEVRSASLGIAVSSGCSCKKCFTETGSKWRIVHKRFAELLGLPTIGGDKISGCLPEGYALSYMDYAVSSYINGRNDMASYLAQFSFSPYPYLSQYFDAAHYDEIVFKMCDVAKSASAARPLDYVSMTAWTARFEAIPFQAPACSLAFSDSGRLFIMSDEVVETTQTEEEKEPSEEEEAM